MQIEVTFTPSEFSWLQAQPLDDAACVVFDVLRATSTIVTALAKGSRAVLPVNDIAEALAQRVAIPDCLLAGERDGRRITAERTGGVEFNLGNSPREYTRAAVQDRRIVTTTTNGTRAFAASRHARHLLAGSLLNLRSTARHLANLRCPRLVLVCAGTGEAAAFEDCLGAGALCHAIREFAPDVRWTDSASFTADLFTANSGDLLAAMQKSSNAVRLLAAPDLAEDVDYCLTVNLHPIVVTADAQGWLHRADPA
jgi:2-phosphosulfolactate phosphatase